MTGIRVALVSSLVMATTSTLGDFIWATWITQHRGIYGITHGVLLFLVAGFVLGRPARRPAAGAVAGALVGALAAGSFYLLAPLLGFSAMFVSWMALWIALAVAHARLDARRPRLVEIATRGAIAAVTSGAAFYVISGIWRPFDPSGWDYAVHFGAWMIAYLPGFVALFAFLPAEAGSHIYASSP
jgi:thiamine transporter ThiT